MITREKIRDCISKLCDVDCCTAKKSHKRALVDVATILYEIQQLLDEEGMELDEIIKERKELLAANEQLRTSTASNIKTLFEEVDEVRRKLIRKRLL